MANTPKGISMGLYFGQSLFFYDADNSNVAEFKAASVTTADMSYTWPAAGPGVNGYVLSCTTAGVMSWTAQSGATFANPSTSIGLSANNGVATTAMRSDATPALDQGIEPTWTNPHQFEVSALIKLGDSATYTSAGGHLNSDVTDRSDFTSAGGTPATLSTYTLPANALISAGDRITIHATGTKTNNAAATLTLSAFFGGATIFSHLFAITQFDWIAKIELAVQIPGAGATIKYSYELLIFTSNIISSGSRYGVGSFSPDLTGTNVIKFTSLATGSGGTPWATEYMMLQDYIKAV